MPPEVDPRVFAFSLATMVLMFGVGIIAPVLPLYAREFGASYAEAGALVAAFAIGRLAFDYVGGLLSDRIPARWLAGGGAAVASLSALGSALAPNYSFLFACRVVEGIGSAFYVTTAMAFITLGPAWWHHVQLVRLFPAGDAATGAAEAMDALAAGNLRLGYVAMLQSLLNWVILSAVLILALVVTLTQAVRRHVRIAVGQHQQ